MRKNKFFPWRWVKRKIGKIAALDSSPSQIAGSISLGGFMSMVPISGLQNLTAILLSFVFRVNKVGTVITLQTICNPLTLPIIIFLDYQMGRFILRSTLPLLEVKSFKELNWQIVLANARNMLKPVFTGGLTLGFLLALLLYPLSFFLIKRYKRRKNTKELKLGED